MWKLLIFLSLLFVDVFSEHQQCPPDWKYIPEYGKCLFKTPTMRWREAEQFCVDRGAHLMSINGKDAIKPASDMVGGWFWIGLYSDSNVQGMKWKFTNNVTVDNIPWNHTVVETGHFTCAAAYNSVVTQGYPCQTQFSGICQLIVSAQK